MMLSFALLTMCMAPCLSTPLVKLGFYDYFTDESSPVIFGGELLMFESIVQASPQWAGHWLPAFANCSCYYRVRHLLTGVVIVNITDTCNYAFGAAFVNTTEGQETFWIFGTHWIRAYSTVPAIKSSRDRTGWTALCDNDICSIDAFWSNDTSLQSWSMLSPAAILPKGAPYVYNNDVTYVPAPTSAVAGARFEASGLPPFTWIMAIEATPEFVGFMITNASIPTTGWQLTSFRVASFPGTNVGACPSIRYDASTGYFYVLTGGNNVSIVRSTDLVNWELGANNGVLLAPSGLDCVQAPSYFASWYTPSSEAKGHIDNCNSWNGWGDDSDVDLIEWSQPNGTIATLFQYGSSNQENFGFSNLAIAQGSMFDVLASFFV